MNRFLTRRKDRALDDNASGGKKGKKGKKGQPEPEPQIDLKTALPSSDDFRTSLIMPSLSTRFSMLREQDDPNSKLGKASDDSVLQPKRQSRLHEFGFVPGGLSDIAEVSSLNGSIRPPFATERQNSFDSTAEDGGSMMSRARPGEGNVLFGGRQKIYKISNTGSSKSLGRVLYEDDVHMSPFQKLRQQEKDRLNELQFETQNVLHSEPSSPTKDTYSPSLSGYSQRRETSSSTNSGTVNTRASTAATSIASQGASSISASSAALPISAAPISPIELNRSGTKARRLYDQALDQHMYDQQSSALNRLNSIQRTRAPTGRSTPPLLFSQTRSATNLNDRFNRTVPLRTDSPVLNGKDNQSASSSPIISRPTSPPLTSPLASDSDDAQTLNSALQPNDRGKATAMGAFNKPKQAFSEKQYAERLKQLQQERDVPGPKGDKPRKPSLRERAEQEQRKRAEAGVPEPQSSDAAEKKQAPSPFSVFQAAANQMRSPVTTTPHSPPKQPAPAPSPQDLHSPDSQRGATFFASPGSSDDEDESSKNPVGRPSDLDRRPHNIPTANGPAPPILEHPALRSRNNSHGQPSIPARSNSRPAPEGNDVQSSPTEPLHAAPGNAPEDPDIDSPTLGPDNGGLSGLIRQHLRNVSNVSSDYGDANQITMSPPPTSTTAPLSLQTQDVGVQRRQPASESNTATHSGYSHSNPWDLDDLENPYYGEGDSISSTSPVDAQKSKSHTTTTTVLPSTPEALEQWEKEIKKTHKREPSADERDAFQRELALRQRAIQESLRTRNDNHTRNVSPGPAGGGGLKTALSMLRAKSSRESFATLDQKPLEAPTKAMRMLGIGANSANASSTSLAGPYGGDHWRSEDRFGQREPPLRQKPSRILQQSDQDAQRELENRQRSATDDSIRDPRPKGRTPSASSRSSTRDRSSSEVSSGRSRSRPGRYRDDLEQAMIEGMGSRSTVYPPNPATPSLPGYIANPTQPLPSERPSLDSQGRMRSRSNSRTAAASYFESKHLQPLQTGHALMNGTSPHLSPAVNSPRPSFSPGLPASPRPSPGAPSPSLNAFRPQPSPVPPFSANNTPPVSGTSTPVVGSFNANAGAGAIITSAGMLRKKSVAKADISDPIFISTTSVIDTVNLPNGASLKNGGDPPPPPVPPINPMRRRFGFGRTAADDPAIHSPMPPFAEPMRTNSSDALSKLPQTRQRLRKTSSEGKSLHGKAQAQAGASPAMPSSPFPGRNYSPPRPINNKPITQRNMDGAMF